MRAALGAPGAPRFSFRRTRPRADGARRAFARARSRGGGEAQRPFGRGGVPSASRVGSARRPPLRRGRRRRRPRCRRCVGVVGPPRCVRPLSPRCDRRARQRPRGGAPRRGRVPIPGSKGGGGARTDARRAASAARGARCQHVQPRPQLAPSSRWRRPRPSRALHPPRLHARHGRRPRRRRALRRHRRVRQSRRCRSRRRRPRRRPRRRRRRQTLEIQGEEEEEEDQTQSHRRTRRSSRRAVGG